jgi:two-component system, sensor histidine kinase and response regulator
MMPRILIIDDEEMVRRSLAMMLQTRGWLTELAAGGRDGLKKARETSPDLIVCDLHMPFMSGLMTLAEARRDPVLQSIPVLMMTGRTGDETGQEALAAGGRAVLLKPFGMEELLDLVAAHLKPPPEEIPPGRRGGSGES